MKETLTLERLKQVYLYDPLTGQFTRLQAANSHKGKAQVGEIAGYTGGRYRRIGIDGQVYPAHRLAVFYMTGKWPEHGVDHKDLDPTNNRWENLRLADQSQNGANTPRRRDNTSGFKGVCKTASGTWQAVIWVKAKKHCLGTYATPQEAFAIYKSAAEKHFGTFSRPS